MQLKAQIKNTFLTCFALLAFYSCVPKKNTSAAVKPAKKGTAPLTAKGDVPPEVKLKGYFIDG